MLLSDVSALLGCEAMGDDASWPQLDIEACFAADLMSEVLAFCPPRALLLTGLASVQAVHTADLADLTAVVFVNDTRPAPAVIALAAERGIPLFRTKLGMFAACGELHRQGIKPACKT
jgi:hypothetical protein